MKKDFIIAYEAEDIYYVADMVSLELEERGDGVQIDSMMILEERDTVLMTLRMEIGYLAIIKEILSAAGVRSSKLYREYYW